MPSWTLVHPPFHRVRYDLPEQRVYRTSLSPPFLAPFVTAATPREDALAWLEQVGRLSMGRRHATLAISAVGNFGTGNVDMMRQDVEDEIRRLCEARDYAGAATRIVEEYGAEVVSLLGSRLRNRADGREVFAMFCEDLWRGLPSFEFRCTARTWVYVLARHAELRFRSQPGQRPQHNLPFSEEQYPLAAMARTTTVPYRQTRFRQRMRALRQRLSEQDELLLLLRVDRRLSWGEIACVFMPDAAGTDERALKRRAALLRQRFQSIKQRLRRLAEAEGLLPPGTGAHELQSTVSAREPDAHAPTRE